MNNELFNQAKQCYKAKDFASALSIFTACLQDPINPPMAGEIGLLYHQIGNCLVKLNNGTEAIQAYTQAMADNAYEAVGAVNCNLATIYASLRDYENAVRHFQIAVSDRTYETPYKAYTGMGNALLKLGKSAEAGVAFREAALDESNPDPTKALLNLGICFMALNRPADAVASYESALPFPMKSDTQNRIYANLGQAYAACGQMAKAVAAFESALADKTYFLSDSASVDYQRAIGAVAQGTTEIPPVEEEPQNDMSGLDVSAEETGVIDTVGYDYPDSYYYDQPQGSAMDAPLAMGGSEMGQPVDDRFFTASEDEIEQWSKGMAKKQRKRKNVGLKILVVIIVLILAVFGAGVFAYTQGYGYPTQETVAQQLFANPQASSSLFSSNLSQDKIDSMLVPVVTDANATVEGGKKSMSESTMYVTAKTPEGGSVRYKVSMVRDMIGWKISNVELYFTSQN